ncbi:MAG TPA: hypothetical protein VKS60_17585 [Stellaceae bacterium]|nr:hypothetical protein [Stellaceae bacterium]
MIAASLAVLPGRAAEMAAGTPQTAATSVTVTNPVTKPVPTSDVRYAQTTPVQFYLFPHSTTSNENAVFYNVPAGQRLVIEYYSAQAQDLTGGAVGLTLSTSVNGSFISYIIFVNQATTDAVNQQTRIYADPGTSVEAFVFNAGTGTSCGALINVSGHLEPVS